MKTEQDDLTLVNKFRAVQDRLNNRVLNRREEAHTAVLALLARKHHFQVGPPGIAKSFLVSELAKCIDLPNGGYYRYLMTKYTVPDELYGPPDLVAFKQGVFRRNTAKKLPVAYLAFLDEIFKGNSSILNANLTLLNERQFFNHDDDPNVPLISCFGASNEVPQGEELNALWDRLHFRHIVAPFTETSDYIRMLEMQTNPLPAVEPILTLEDIRAAHAEVDAVVLGDDVLKSFRDLRDALRKESIEPTERRWVECLGICKAEAWLNGNTIVDIGDTRPLQHVLWTEQGQVTTVRRILLQLANPVDKKAADLLDDVNGLDNDLREALRQHENDSKSLINACVEIHEKLGRTKGEMLALEDEEKRAPRKSVILADLKKKVAEVAQALKTDGFKR
jgi:MoxR-like ATPase